MTKFINFLFKIDDLLSNWPCQIILLLFSLWSLQLKDSYWSIWVALGFMSYAYLMYQDIYGEHSSAKEMKESYEKHGLLPFLKGFNYSAILGPATFLLRYLLAKIKPD